MHELRGVKEPEEIQQLQIACDITEKGFRRVLGMVKPGVTEYEIEAEFVHEFVRNRSKGFAYEPIIASGPSACVLHYVENNKACLDGELLLLDVAAEYGNYNAEHDAYHSSQWTLHQATASSHTMPSCGWNERQQACYVLGSPFRITTERWGW